MVFCRPFKIPVEMPFFPQTFATALANVCGKGFKRLRRPLQTLYFFRANFGMPQISRYSWYFVYYLYFYIEPSWEDSVFGSSNEPSISCS